jgi:multicomponent K+:H+ antiporter subunit A
MPLLTLIALPFIGSVIAALLPTNARNAASGWAGLIALIAFAQALLLIPDVLDGSVLREQWQWLPSAGLDFVVRVDGFAWMFSLLVLGIGLLVVLYARYYMSRDDPVARFFSFFLDKPFLVPADRLLVSPP